MKEKINLTLKKNKEKYIEYLQDLIKIDTQVIGHGIDGGKEKLGQDYLIKLLKEMNADEITLDQMEESTIDKAIKKYGEGNKGHNYDDRYNVVAEFKGEDESQTLLFNGHMDTMPPGSLKFWNEDPWSANIKDGKLYGLGAADMKSGLMASVMAVKLLQDAGINLPINVKIASVVDEEGGGNGSISLVTKGIKADAAIVCEPTELSIKRAHMGFIFFEIKTSGIALHSGSKWLGVNAIEKMISLIESLRDLEHEWLMRYKHEILPPPTLNIGVIKGGTAGSTVPDECSLQICVHYLPEIMSREMVIKDITNAIEMRSHGDEWLRDNSPSIEIYQAGNGFETSEKSKIVQKAYLELKNLVPGAKIVGATAGNDARLYSNIAGIPTVIAGPGNLEQCHTPNEFVYIEEYLTFIEMYSNLIVNWNNGGKYE